MRSLTRLAYDQTVRRAYRRVVPRVLGPLPQANYYLKTVSDTAGRAFIRRSKTRYSR